MKIAHETCIQRNALKRSDLVNEKEGESKKDLTYYFIYKPFRLQPTNMCPLCKCSTFDQQRKQQKVYQYRKSLNTYYHQLSAVTLQVLCPPHLLKLFIHLVMLHLLSHPLTTFFEYQAVFMMSRNVVF